MNEVLIAISGGVLKSACEIDVNNDRYRVIYFYIRSDRSWVYCNGLKDTIKEVLRTSKTQHLVSMEEYIENYFELLL